MPPHRHRAAGVRAVAGREQSPSAPSAVTMPSGAAVIASATIRGDGISMACMPLRPFRLGFIVGVSMPLPPSTRPSPGN
jgi:hypothetical protein